MKLEYLKLTNFRGFREFEITFDPSFTVLLGNNMARASTPNRTRGHAPRARRVPEIPSAQEDSQPRLFTVNRSAGSSASMSNEPCLTRNRSSTAVVSIRQDSQVLEGMLVWPIRETYDPLVVFRPRTWLLREAWKRHGSISACEVPGKRS